ncbi:MAG: AAA family ATPase, partial [Polaromonas sp.]
LLESSVLNARENLHVLAAPALPYQTEEVTPETLQNIIALARCEYDFVILDLGRTMDPATVKALDLAERIYLVLQLSLPAIQDVKRMATVFQGLGYSQDKLDVVVNRHEKQGLIRLDEVERATRTKVARTIPASDEAVMASINQGAPLPLLSARDPVSRALQEWAHDLSPVAVKPGRSWFASLTGGL